MKGSTKENRPTPRRRINYLPENTIREYPVTGISDLFFLPSFSPKKVPPPHFKITIPLKWQYKELFLCNNGAYTIDFKANLLLLFIGCGGSLGLSNIFSQFCNPSSQPSLTLSCPRSHFTVRFNLNQLFNYFFKVCYQKKIL